MDWLAILMIVCASFGFIIGVFAGIKTSESRLLPELERCESDAIEVQNWFLAEYQNVLNQLQLADNAAEAWRQEAYEHGYKPNQS